MALVTRPMIVEFRNQTARKASATTTNHDLKAIKFIFRSAKRDSYIVEDPSEFVESVRKTSKDARRPFTIPKSGASTMRQMMSGKALSCSDFILASAADLAILSWDNIDLVRNEIRLVTRKTHKRLSIPIAAPLRTHLDSLPNADKPGTWLHPKAAATVAKQKRSGTLSNQFADLFAQAGLGRKAPIRIKEKAGIGNENKADLAFTRGHIRLSAF